MKLISKEPLELLTDTFRNNVLDEYKKNIYQYINNKIFI